MTPAPLNRLTPEEARARGRRNVAIAVALLAFVVLLFLITLTQLGPGVLDRPL
jgi:hypothetical protein